MRSSETEDAKIHAFLRARVPGRSRKAREIREELGEHIREAIAAHKAKGMSDAEAFERVTQDLGTFTPLRRWVWRSSLRGQIANPRAILFSLSIFFSLASILPVYFIILPNGFLGYTITGVFLWQIWPLAVPFYGCMFLSAASLLWNRAKIRLCAWICAAASAAGLIQLGLRAYGFGTPLDTPYHRNSHPMEGDPLWIVFYLLAAAIVFAIASLCVRNRGGETGASLAE